MAPEKSREIAVLKVSDQTLWCVDWSPDGTRLVAGGGGGGVYALTSKGRRLWATHEHSPNAYDVRWSPDGSRVASAGGTNDHSVRIWNAATGRPVLVCENANFAVAWSPDGGRLAWQRFGSVYIGDATSGQTIRELTGAASSTWSLAWSPDGMRLASGHDDEHVARIWDPASGDCTAVLRGHANWVFCVRWSPLGRQLATTSWDHSVRIWNATSGVAEFVCSGHTDYVWSVSWSPDGRVVASGSSDGTVRIWSAQDGAELLRLDSGKEDVRCISVAFASHGVLASAWTDGCIRLWDVRDLAGGTTAVEGELAAYVRRHAATVGRQAPQPAEPALWVPHLPEAEGKCLGVLCSGETASQGSVAVFPDGRSLAIGHPEGRLARWDFRTDQELWEATADDPYDLAVSPDGRLLASASGGDMVRVWAAADGALRQTCQGHSGNVLRVRWSPDGTRLASAGHDAVRLWDPNSGRCLREFAGHSSFVEGLCWSPKGEHLASASFDNTVRIWEVRTGRELHCLQGHGNDVWSVCWSPDGRSLASGGNDGTIIVWDVATGAERRRWGGGGQDNAADVRWSPDGRLIAGVFGSGPGRVSVWNADTGQELERFTAKEGAGWRLAWSPDGAFLASTHSKDTVRLWDTRHLVAGRAATISLPTARPGAVPPALRHLPEALAQTQRLGFYPALSLLADLLGLTGGDSPGPVWETLRTEPGLQSLVRLRWPRPARLGIVALLLHQTTPDEAWQPPRVQGRRVSPSEVAEALQAALAGPECTPSAPSPPLAALRAAVRQVDDRLLTLLELLGHGAVAADPALPLRLLPRLGQLPPLTSPRRRLLGMRLNMSGASDQGRSVVSGRLGAPMGIDIGSLPPDPRVLLASQWALPPEVLLFKHLRRELLYRARSGDEPPQLRPVVLLLDVSPPSLAVDAVTRLAAYTVGRTLVEARVPAVLVTSGGQEAIFRLERTEDLLEIWTSRTWEPARPVRSLKLADALRDQLRDGPLEPVVLLFSHVWYCADDPPPPIPHLRGLFVQYPRHSASPKLAAACERWHCLAAGETAGLLEILGRLAG